MTKATREVFDKRLRSCLGPVFMPSQKTYSESELAGKPLKQVKEENVRQVGNTEPVLTIGWDKD